MINIFGCLLRCAAKRRGSPVGVAPPSLGSLPRQSHFTTCSTSVTLKLTNTHADARTHTYTVREMHWGAFPFRRSHIQNVPHHLAQRWTSLPLSSIILITSMGKCLIHGYHSVLPSSNLMYTHSPTSHPAPRTQFHLFIFNPNPLFSGGVFFLNIPPSSLLPSQSYRALQLWNWTLFSKHNKCLVSCCLYFCLLLFFFKMPDIFIIFFYYYTFFMPFQLETS